MDNNVLHDQTCLSRPTRTRANKTKNKILYDCCMEEREKTAVSTETGAGEILFVLRVPPPSPRVSIIIIIFFFFLKANIFCAVI